MIREGKQQKERARTTIVTYSQIITDIERFDSRKAMILIFYKK